MSIDLQVQVEQCQFENKPHDVDYYITFGAMLIVKIGV
jgi:hypothetical protein